MLCTVALQVASCHSSASGTLSAQFCDSKLFFKQSLEQQAKQLSLANYINAVGCCVTEEKEHYGVGGGCLGMISFCQWVRRNYIFYLGVIGEPLQMLSAAHLFI